MMIEGKASLIIDLGNSETRVRTIYGTTETGEPRQRLSVLPNKFGEITEKDTRLLSNPDYNATNSKVFLVETSGVSNIVEENGVFFNAEQPVPVVSHLKFCSGYICDREKGTASLRPSASIKKYNSAITMYSVRLAFLEGMYHIADIMKTSVDLIDVNWNVTVLLPPSDLELGSETIKGDIMSLDSINFIIPNFTKKLKIEKVMVFPEGFCAFIGAVFESKRKIRKGYEGVLMSSTLVIDIGAGTSDLCIIKDAKLVDGSRHSEETGGNQVFQKMNIELRRKFGKNFPEDSLRDASVTGVIKIGSREIDVASDISISRKEVASKLSSAIRNYIESSDFSIFDIENILICGGGAEECGKNMKPLGEYLREDLKDWMSYSDFLDIPTVDKIVTKDGIQYLEKEKISPRLLNIIGASVLSEI